MQDAAALSIAVIGAGPTAVALLESLIRSRDIIGPDVSLDVTVFDPSPHPWCGHSFAPDRPEALTNTYTNTMSVRHWQPEHAGLWLTANGNAEFAGNKFAPRSIIGQYFKDSAQLAASRLEGFAFIRERVTSLTVIDDRVHLYTQNGGHSFDYAVLSVGRSDKFDPYGLEGQENFCIRSYPLTDALTGVDPDEHIGIIGTGLTAVDLVMALKADKHRGRITLLSRNGLLPAVRPPSFKYELQRFTVKAIEDRAAAKGGVSLEDLVHLVHEELDHACVSPEPLTEEIFPNRYGIDRLRHQLMHIDDDTKAYSILIKTLLVLQDAWYFLNPVDKARAAGFRHIYCSLCCPMPRHRAAGLLGLADAGQLDVVRGVSSMAKDAGGQFVAVAENHPPLHFDRVFSAGSSGNAPDPVAVPLVDSLLQSGQARAHPFGGLDIERTTSRLLDANSRPQPRLYAVGTMTSGAFQVLNGYPVLRLRTGHIAEAMLKHGEESRDRRPTHRAGAVIENA
ncbi:FAD/NAD(P)-binding protein [Chelativorans alearense]|uniref:FAD/NAD(P)-binding protein n=1 Tax=Chelativorans alearense TaxID=2681495 RepID=UPI0013D827EA|nr:FAD/NAD(P)-binding protein [Chelativorans alearense]